MKASFSFWQRTRAPLLPLAGEGAPTQSGRMSGVPDEGHSDGQAALLRRHGPGGAAPHPALRATFSRRREKGGLRRDVGGGFTLVELLVVLVILGLVMGLVGPRVLGYLSSSRERTAHLQIESFASALDLFYLDYGRYPTNNEGLEALVRRPASGEHWAGPYLKQPNVPSDPWGNAYTYHVPGKQTPYAITSLGPDGGHGASVQRAAIGNE